MAFLSLSNTTLLDKDSYEIAFKYKVAGGVDYSIDYKRLYPILIQIIPDKFKEWCVDVPLERAETEAIRESIKTELLFIIDKMPEVLPNHPDVRNVLEKNILLDLKDQEGKVIHTFDTIIQIANECLEKNQPMYFAYEEEYRGNSNYKGLRKDKKEI
jgi:hypothetical protein